MKKKRRDVRAFELTSKGEKKVFYKSPLEMMEEKGERQGRGSLTK